MESIVSFESVSKGNSGDWCAHWYVSKTLPNDWSNGMPMLGDVWLKAWLDSCVECFLASFFIHASLIWGHFSKYVLPKTPYKKLLKIIQETNHAFKLGYIYKFKGCFQYQNTPFNSKSYCFQWKKN